VNACRELRTASGCARPIVVQLPKIVIVFLGWTRDDQDWIEYIELCGWARAHARNGRSSVDRGLSRENDTFDRAIATFVKSFG
jgi:hypothetical protein